MYLNSRDCENVVVVCGSLHQVGLSRSKGTAAKTFTFDEVFASDTPQRTIYEQSAFSLIESVLEGYNGISSLI